MAKHEEISVELDEFRLWTIDEVAEVLQMNVGWLYKKVEAGEFPVVRFGRRSLRFKPSDVLAFIDSAHVPVRTRSDEEFTARRPSRGGRPRL